MIITSLLCLSCSEVQDPEGKQESNLAGAYRTWSEEDLRERLDMISFVLRHDVDPSTMILSGTNDEISDHTEKMRHLIPGFEIENQIIKQDGDKLTVFQETKMSDSTFDSLEIAREAIMIELARREGS